MEEKSPLPFVLASRQHRLGGHVLEGVFAILTLYIGWIIWSLIIWGQGRTPGHQIVKMRIYSIDTGKPASWGHMAIRQVLLPLSFFLAPWALFVVMHLIPNSSIQLAVGVIMYLTISIIWLVDIFWIFRGEKNQRLTDVFARTIVLNECQPA
jgi:uncharacterized RDD family membrane protein YckC